MKDSVVFFKNLYRDFNDRNIERVIAAMTEDVKWANGMEGGYVYGHEGVRQYWTRQFTIINSTVTPLEIEANNGTIKVQVHQVVHGLDKKLLADEIVEHIFHLKDGKIAEFTIGNKLQRPGSGIY